MALHASLIMEPIVDFPILKQKLRDFWLPPYARSCNVKQSRPADGIAFRNLESSFDVIWPTTFSKYLNDSGDIRINVIHTCRKYNFTHIHGNNLSGTYLKYSFSIS